MIHSFFCLQFHFHQHPPPYILYVAIRWLSYQYFVLILSGKNIGTSNLPPPKKSWLLLWLAASKIKIKHSGPMANTFSNQASAHYQYYLPFFSVLNWSSYNFKTSVQTHVVAIHSIMYVLHAWQRPGAMSGAEHTKMNTTQSLPLRNYQPTLGESCEDKIPKIWDEKLFMEVIPAWR